MEIEGGRFLVIGGAELIGSHLVEQLLSEGAAQVRVYDNFSRGTPSNLRAVQSDSRLDIFAGGGDILHRDILLQAMQGMDGAFHLAAMWLLQCNNYPRSAFDVNVVGAMNVIETAIESKIKKLISSSSASVYGDALTEPMTEDHPLNCQEFYGASKVCGEMLLRALFNHQRQKGGGFDCVGLRYMNVYGKRQDDKGAYVGVAMRMLSALDAGEQLTIHGDGSRSYDFVDVRDCARANILAMKSSISNEFYNIGTGIKTSIIELAGLLCKISQRELNAHFECHDRPFVMNRVGSTESARRDIRFDAKVDLETGLRDLVEWRSNNKLKA